MKNSQCPAARAAAAAEAKNFLKAPAGQTVQGGGLLKHVMVWSGRVAGRGCDGSRQVDGTAAAVAGKTAIRGNLVAVFSQAQAQVQGPHTGRHWLQAEYVVLSQNALCYYYCCCCCCCRCTKIACQRQIYEVPTQAHIVLNSGRLRHRFRCAL